MTIASFNSLLFTQFADKTTIMRKSPTFAFGDTNFQNKFERSRHFAIALLTQTTTLRRRTMLARSAVLFGPSINGSAISRIAFPCSNRHRTGRRFMDGQARVFEANGRGADSPRLRHTALRSMSRDLTS